MKYYAALKMKKIWHKLQKGRQLRTCMIPLVWGTWSSQIHKAEWWLLGGGEVVDEVGKLILYDGIEFPLQKIKNFLEMNGGDSCVIIWMYLMLQEGFLGGSIVKNLPIMQDMQAQPLGQEDPL